MLCPIISLAWPPIGLIKLSHSTMKYIIINAVTVAIITDSNNATSLLEGWVRFQISNFLQYLFSLTFVSQGFLNRGFLKITGKDMRSQRV